MEDLPVGAEVTLKVVETKEADCSGCCFDEISSNIYGNVCGDFNCSASNRKDGKDVRFKRVK